MATPMDNVASIALIDLKTWKKRFCLSQMCNWKNNFEILETKNENLLWA